jgi:hypothetical protein
MQSAAGGNLTLPTAHVRRPGLMFAVVHDEPDSLPPLLRWPTLLSAAGVLLCGIKKVLDRDGGATAG